MHYYIVHMIIEIRVGRSLYNSVDFENKEWDKCKIVFVVIIW